MANKARKYAVIFEAADGLHVADMSVSNDRISEAHAHAAQMFKGLKYELRPVKGPAEVKAIANEILKKYPSRTPIDEKTGGFPNLVLNDHDIVKDEV